jgi:uncharacterized integral membrane protein (TIGR00697 family)
MPLALAILWAALASAFAIGGAWYARRYGRADALIACYVALTVIANLLAVKILALHAGPWTLYAPAATLIFSVTFFLTDIVNERFGRAETQRMIWIALFAQLALVLFSYLAVAAEPAPFFAGQAAFALVLGSAPRVATAGMLTFLVSESFDAFLFQWFRRATRGRHLWMRNAFSSLPAMALDSALFVVLAFAGTEPVVPIIVGLTITKWIVGIVDIPFMYLAKAVLDGGRVEAERAI